MHRPITTKPSGTTPRTPQGQAVGGKGSPQGRQDRTRREFGERWRTHLFKFIFQNLISRFQNDWLNPTNYYLPLFPVHAGGEARPPSTQPGPLIPSRPGFLIVLAAGGSSPPQGSDRRTSIKGLLLQRPGRGARAPEGPLRTSRWRLPNHRRENASSRPHGGQGTGTEPSCNPAPLPDLRCLSTPHAAGCRCHLCG